MFGTWAFIVVLRMLGVLISSPQVAIFVALFRRTVGVEADLDAVFAHFQLSQVSTALLGHSHGALISIRYLQTRPHAVAAAYITSPLLGIAVQAPAWKERLGRAMSRFMPRVSLPGEVKAEWVCRDPEVVRAYTSDPLNHHIVNARWYTETLGAMDSAFSGPAPKSPTRIGSSR